MHVASPDLLPQVTGFTNSEEKAVQKEHLVPFMLEDRLKELGGLFERGPDWSQHAVRDGQLITGGCAAWPCRNRAALQQQLLFDASAVIVPPAGCRPEPAELRGSGEAHRCCDPAGDRPAPRQGRGRGFSSPVSGVPACSMHSVKPTVERLMCILLSRVSKEQAGDP